MYFKKHVSAVPVGLVRLLTKSKAHPQNTHMEERELVLRKKQSPGGEGV